VWGRLGKGRFVLVGNVEEAARKVVGALEGYQRVVERVMPMAEFRREVSRALGVEKGLSEDDVKVLLVHLGRDRRVLAYDQQVSLVFIWCCVSELTMARP
jgi:charged multivesicular body protein 7